MGIKRDDLDRWTENCRKVRPRNCMNHKSLNPTITMYMYVHITVDVVFGRRYVAVHVVTYFL